MVGGVWLTARLDSQAIQYNYALLEELPEGADREDYIAVMSEIAAYEVKEGDTLWGISRRFLKTGTRYEEILQENSDVVSDINHLMPGQVIHISKQMYIPRDKYDRGGLVSEGAYHIALPDMVDHDYFLGTDIEDFTFLPGIAVFSLPVTNRMGENALTENWQDFTAEVKRCSELCEGRVSNLQFERYTMEDACDLCGYTFDFDAGDKVVEFAAFYRLGARNMAEVVGVRERRQNTKLTDVTRYIAASFEDFGGQISAGYTKYGDNVGAYDWNYPELHNLFTAAMTNYIDYVRRPERNVPGDYELEWKEPVFEQAVRNALTELWQLDEEEEKAFLGRPVMASDIAVITEIQCILYPEGYKSAARDSKEASAPVVYLVCNGNPQRLYFPEENDEFSYDDLSQFTEARVLSLGIRNLTDYSFVADMPQLKGLHIRVEAAVDDLNFLAGLKELRALSLKGAGDYDGEGKSGAFLGIEDLGVLENCTELRYLYLQSPRVTDFSFLEKCPDICTIELSGSAGDGLAPVSPELELLSNASFIEFYGTSMRFAP